jgi:endonuclease III
MFIDINHFITTLAREVEKYQVPVVDLIAVQTRDPFKVLVAQTRDPFKILGATILSARTKDETTAKASAKLFKKISDLDSLENLDEATIAKLIYPVGFYMNKAKYLKELPLPWNSFAPGCPIV